MKLIFLIFAVYLFVIAKAFDREEARRALQNPDLYDGDMAGIEGPFDAERNAIPGDSYRWPLAIVPYVLDSALTPYEFIIQEAMNNYEQNTCVQFVKRTHQKDYVKLFIGKGCYSHVGKTGGEQPLSLGNGCLYIGTAIHELGHALGFYHEQNRSDRDEYLTIYLQNVKPGLESNFAKLSPNQNLLYNKFDYESIMIYGNKAFSKNKEDTMIAKNGQKLIDPFNKNKMTASDIARVNKMYGC